MPSESETPNIAPVQTLEQLKKKFAQKLEAIWNKELTVENIENFADDALREIIALNAEVIAEAKKLPGFKAKDKSGKELEDEAYKFFELPKNIQEVLQAIIDKKEQIDALKKYIDKNHENIDRVITPPQDLEVQVIEGSGTFSGETRLRPRLLTLMYILENDFSIPSENVKITEGTVIPEMMRRTPYVRVEIPDRERVIYLCDEEKNASYVFDTIKLVEKGLSLEEVDINNKSDKSSLIMQYPGIGIRLIQTKNWRDNVSGAIEKPIPEIQRRSEENRKHERKSEFIERKKWLPFEEFQVEVRNLYPGHGDVANWYSTEQKGHPNWPSAPYVVYKNMGWIDWSELVGKENPQKREFLTFEELQVEVKNLYTGENNVEDWYTRERIKHPNWPSNPNVRYGDEGWAGWPDLVGRENFLKKKFLPFDKFKKEVRVLYSGQRDIKGWYKKERKKHANWPANPRSTYKNQGWVGFLELVGREKKVFLPFEDFKSRVRVLYPGKVGIVAWYAREQLNHTDWPVSPDVTYKNYGWINWEDLKIF